MLLFHIFSTENYNVQLVRCFLRTINSDQQRVSAKEDGKIASDTRMHAAIVVYYWLYKIESNLRIFIRSQWKKLQELQKCRS